MTSSERGTQGEAGSGTSTPYRMPAEGGPVLPEGRVRVRDAPSIAGLRRLAALLVCAFATMPGVLALIAWTEHAFGPAPASYTDAVDQAGLLGAEILLAMPLYVPALLWLAAARRGRRRAAVAQVSAEELAASGKALVLPVLPPSERVGARALVTEGLTYVSLPARGEESSRVVTGPDADQALADVEARGEAAPTFRFSIRRSRATWAKTLAPPVLVPLVLLAFAWMLSFLSWAGGSVENASWLSHALGRIAFPLWMLVIYILPFFGGVAAIVVPWVFFIVELWSYAALVVEDRGVRIGKRTMPYTRIASVKLERRLLRIRTAGDKPQELIVRAWPAIDWPQLEMIKSIIDAGLARVTDPQAEPALSERPGGQ
jgi:hypothetical protein